MRSYTGHTKAENKKFVYTFESKYILNIFKKNIHLDTNATKVVNYPSVTLTRIFGYNGYDLLVGIFRLRPRA